MVAQFHPHEYLLAEDLEKAQWDHRNWFQIILFLTQTSSRPLSIICLQLKRWSVGSAHLPHWNNCCDDRLCWEHGQACENKHHFWLEILETRPKLTRLRRCHIISTIISDQFFLRVLQSWISKGFHGNFFDIGLPLRSNVLRVVSKCCTAGSKRCCFDGAQCHPQMNTFSFWVYRWLITYLEEESVYIYWSWSPWGTGISAARLVGWTDKIIKHYSSRHLTTENTRIKMSDHHLSCRNTVTDSV